jgi:hypothetical protein
MNITRESQTCRHRQPRWIQYQIVLPCVLALASVIPGVRAAEEEVKPGLPSHLGYRSPLADYRKFVEQPVESWREANEQVGRVGGWRAYASEAQELTPAPTSPQEEGEEHAVHHQEPSK